MPGIPARAPRPPRRRPSPGRPARRRRGRRIPPATGAAKPAERKPSGFSNLLLHLHPRVVPAEALAFPRTFGLGGIAVVLFLLLLATGALLLFGYEPSPERAYGSVREIIDRAPFGEFVRNVHHWAANGFLLVALPAPAAGLLHRRPPPAAARQLDRGARPAAAGGRVQLHRLPASLGPARLLGGDDRDRDARVRAPRRRHAAEGGARRQRGRVEDARAVLRDARGDPPDPALHADRLPFLAGAQARRRDPPRAGGGGRRAPHAGPDLAAPRRPRGRGGARDDGRRAPRRGGLSKRRCWRRRTPG